MKCIKTCLVLFLAAVLLCSCSSNDEEEKEGRIETMTKEIGQEAVRAIKTPIEKAQAVADEQEERAREMDERNEK